MIELPMRGVIDKPAGSRMAASVSGTLTDTLDVSNLKATLGNLELTATDIDTDDEPASAKIDTNNFNLASVAPMVTPIANYGIAGNGRTSRQRSTDRSFA